MKIRIIKKATVFLLASVFIFATAVGVLAAPYYDAGTPSNSTVGTAMILGGSGANLNISFYNNVITGPTDPLAAPNISQFISGTYNLENKGAGIYSLKLTSGSQSDITTYNTNPGGKIYLTAKALATEINFNNHTISWGDVKDLVIQNNDVASGGLGSQSLTDLAASTAGWAFTSVYGRNTMTFEQIGNESTWLGGTTGGGHARYYSRLEGFSAAPEPAEWVLMFIGLGMLGLYLQRRGYLEFDLSRQSVA